jgi:hypothetical protein
LYTNDIPFIVTVALVIFVPPDAFFICTEAPVVKPAGMEPVGKLLSPAKIKGGVVTGGAVPELDPPPPPQAVVVNTNSTIIIL